MHKKSLFLFDSWVNWWVKFLAQYYATLNELIIFQWFFKIKNIWNEEDDKKMPFIGEQNI